MSLTFPRTNILTAAGFADQTLVLVPVQELSTMASGVNIGKDFGSAIWQATYVTEPLRNDLAVPYEALLNSLDGVIRPFEACDLRRVAPRRHTDGSGNDGVLLSVNANKKAITLGGLAAAQTVSLGDYLSFDFDGRRALHQVMEDAVANGGGVTPEFEVRPHLRRGWQLGTAVNLKAPRGLFNLKPNSIVPRMANGRRTAVTFQAVQLP